MMRIRTLIGVTLLVLIGLFPNVRVLKPADQFVYRFTGITEIVPDGVTLYEQRFSVLRALLPRHGTVGYVTDQDMRDYAAHEKWLAVRYTLAPVLVENSPRHVLVVGNIAQPATDLQQFLHENNLTLLKNLGDGVLLLGGSQR